MQLSAAETAFAERLRGLLESHFRASFLKQLEPELAKVGDVSRAFLGVLFIFKVVTCSKVFF